MAGRRKFLQIAAGATAAPGAAPIWRAWDQGVFSTGTDPAYEAWNSRGLEPAGSSQRLLMHAAIVAASQHNTQPWRFRVAPDSIDLPADHARHDRTDAGCGGRSGPPEPLRGLAGCAGTAGARAKDSL
jgi:hypothetical protein